MAKVKNPKKKLKKLSYRPLVDSEYSHSVSWKGKKSKSRKKR